DLFYNVPARLKFLRSPATELGHINDTIFKFALSHPEISFKFSHNKSELLNVPVTKKYEERILALFNKVWLENMIRVEDTEGFLKLTGYISKPEFTRTLNTNQWLFLNKRPIQNKLVSHAVGQGYKELLPNGRTPVFVLFMELDGAEFDVNVHPTKREVKFIHSTQVHQEIADKIRKTLQNARLIPKINLEKTSIIQDIRNNASYVQYKPLDIIQERKDEISETIREYQASFDEDSVGEKTSDTIEELMPIAQLNGKYILARHKNGLIIIDQHAAHEKIVYEKLTMNDVNKKPQQGLLSPINIEFDFKTAQILLENIQLFNEVGFDIEEFGKNVFILRAVPINFKNTDYREIFLTMLEELSETEISQPKKKDAIFKSIACHSSVRSGDKLEFAEMEKLLKEFQKLKIPYCPHGRPASLNLTYGELDVRFGRK
ncbi:MAG: DNA mismatch repair endonuclease MutL, partial [Candidatus Firestonebacteria bacterium]